MHVLLVGGGKVGAFLSQTLVGSGHQVRLVESRREQFPALERDLPADILALGDGRRAAENMHYYLKNRR